MAYMSYCRFEGTKEELRICLSDVEEHINGEEAVSEISYREIECFKSMVYNFVDFLTDNELLNEFNEVDDEKLKEVCEKMAQSREGESYDW